MDSQSFEEKYKAMGLVALYQSDKPETVYEPHRHGKVYIYTLKGSAKIKLDGGDWQTFGPGQELAIKDDQLHEAIAGPEGWEYIFATTQQEAKRQGLL